MTQTYEEILTLYYLGQLKDNFRETEYLVMKNILRHQSPAAWQKNWSPCCYKKLETNLFCSSDNDSQKIGTVSRKKSGCYVMALM